MSLKSRSFLHRVNDQVRKRQYQCSKDATKDSDNHSVICGMCMSSTLEASVFMVKNYSDNWHSIRNTEDLTLKQMFDIFWEIDIRTIRWDLWSENNYLGRLFMEVFVFDWWWTSHQSLAHKGLRILRFCIVSWKDEREPSIKYCMGRQIDLVQKFIRIQSFGQNWWWANGIRVEYLPRIHHIAALQQSPRVLVEYEHRARKFHWTDYLHVDVQRHLMGILRQWKGMRIKRSARFSLCEKIFTRTMVIPRTWIRKRNDILLSTTNHKENGTELQSKWCWHLQKANTQSSDPWVHCLEECLRAKVVENCRYASVPMRDAIETVFRTIISVNQLSIYGAVAEMCEEYESCHDRTGRPVVKGQSSSSFVPSVIKTYIPLTHDPAQEEDLLQRYGERTEKLSQQDSITTRQIEQMLYWCRIPDYSWSRTVFPDERHWRIFTIHRFSGLSWVHFAKRRKFIWTKRLDSREHQDWTRIGSYNLLPTR